MALSSVVSGVAVRVFSFLVFWILFPPLYLLVSPLYVYRIFVKWLASVKHPEWVGMMNVRDVFVSERLEPEKKTDLSSVVTLVFVLSGVVNLEELRKKFTQKVLLQEDKFGKLAYTKFGHYYEYWLGFPFWKREENFSLDQHIRMCEETCGTTGPEGVSEETMLNIMGDIATKTFKRKTSPWEMLIVDNYKPKESFLTGSHSEKGSEEAGKRFLLIFRFHHTLLDGFSVVKLVVENFGGQPRNNTPRPPRRKPSLAKTVLKILEVITCVGYHHLKVLFLDYDFHRWHVSSRRELAGKWHTVTTPPIPFGVAKEASEKAGVAMSAVLFSAVAGGLRRYLLLTDREDQLPEVLRGYLALPVPSHPLDGMTNCWTFANVPLPIKAKTSMERLQSLHDYFRMLKRSVMPGVIWVLSPMYMGVPKWLVNIWGANRTTTIQLSNFPGPRKQIVFFDNWIIEDTMFWLPRLRGNSSISVAVLTYNGGIRITVTLDKAVFPDRRKAQKIADAIQEELESYVTCENIKCIEPLGVV